METQELENMAAKQATPTTSKDDVEDEPVFKTAHSNPEEAKKFIKSIVTLVDKFMADITSYDIYKQEEAYTEFVWKYVKERPEKATPDTTEMDTMPPLEDNDDDDNGAKKKKFKFKKPTPKPHC